MTSLLGNGLISCVLMCACLGTAIAAPGNSPGGVSPGSQGNQPSVDASTMFERGMTYYDGKAVVQSYAHALPLISRAAHLGYAKAQTQLGTMYQEGYGVPINDKAAMHWFMAAAHQGNSTGINNLGNLYLHGRGVERDYAKARALFRQAATMGNPTAQANLGWLYFNGVGVTRNCAKAVALYRQASAQNDPSGESNLAAAHFFGCGASQSDTDALKWALIAQRSAIAQPDQITNAALKQIQNNIANLRTRMTKQEINAAKTEYLHWNPSG
ncbi:MAG: sel1 repeat family protein [Gallionella sp.]|nr:sel1 repeat family protein [Gallionella sp.]